MLRWDLSDIPDQTGRTVVVTGANSGLGEVTARVLAERGARVVLACRDLDKGAAAARRMTGAVTVGELDLADLGSIRRFTATVEHLDVLVNNAGVMAVPLGRTVDGFERQLGTNFLGTFALTALLLPKITDRVVTLSSLAHRVGRIDFDDPNWQRRTYRRWPAYAQSKLADLMFAYELHRRLTALGSPVRSVAAHPGFARTELHTHTASVQGPVIAASMRFAGQDATAGALPSLFAATSPDVVGGQLYGPGGLGEVRGLPRRSTSSRRSRDPGVAARLWDLACDLTGVDFLSPALEGTSAVEVGGRAEPGTTSARVLSGLLVGTAGIHFAAPQTFDDSIPPRLPGRPRTWVHLAGAALAATGLAVLDRRTRRPAALAAAGIFVAILPANVQMVLNAATPAERNLLIARLPLQIPLITWAMRVARRS